MDPNIKSKIPPVLSLTSVLSSGLTIVVSVTYIVICILAVVYRFQCDAGLVGKGSDYFLHTLYRVYIQGDWCENPESSAPAGATLLSTDTVFIFVLVTLGLSVASFAAAICLIVVVNDEKNSQYIFAAVWVYFGVYFSVLAVDLVFAVFLGIDYADLTGIVSNSSPGIILNYRPDVLRLGTQLLMAVALKGYLAPVLNSVLVVLLLVYATKFRKQLQTEEHSIHKRGAINAYELQKREYAWQTQQESDSTFRGQHLNPGFVHDERPPRSPRTPRTPQAPMDYSNRDYDRSEPWQQPRPFSYAEEPRRARSPSPAAAEPWRREPSVPSPAAAEPWRREPSVPSPAAAEPWRREPSVPSPAAAEPWRREPSVPSPAAAEPWRREPWPAAPPVPAPDYSPPARRLKSALKPNYM